MLETLAMPPYDAVMPDAQRGMIAVWATLAAASLIFCCISSIRSRSLLPLSIFLGAGLAMFGEALVIHKLAKSRREREKSDCDGVEWR